MITGKEISKAGKATVRNSPSLYPAYKTLFKEAFGREPECPTCGSSQGNKDWEAFKNHVILYDIQTSNIQEIMIPNKDTTFVLRSKNEIYTYDFKHQNGRVLRARTWGYSMTEDFAEAFLSNEDNLVSETVIELRKGLFKVLPAKFLEPAEEIIEDDSLEDLTVAQLKEKLVELEVPEADYKGLKKPELIILLETKQIEAENPIETAVAEDQEDLLD